MYRPFCSVLRRILPLPLALLAFSFFAFEPVRSSRGGSPGPWNPRGGLGSNSAGGDGGRAAGALKDADKEDGTICRSTVADIISIATDAVERLRFLPVFSLLLVSSSSSSSFLTLSQDFGRHYQEAERHLRDVQTSTYEIQLKSASTKRKLTS